MPNIAAVIGGNLAQALAVNADFPKPPVLLAGASLGEEEAIRVKMKHRINQGLQIARLIKRGELGLAAQARKNHQRVVPVPLARRVIAGMGVERAHPERAAHGVAGGFGVGKTTLQQQQSIEIEQRVGQQRLPLERQQVARSGSDRPRVA